MATGPKWEFAPSWKGIDFDIQFESSLWVIDSWLIKLKNRLSSVTFCIFRDHKRFWMGVRCSSKRSFICESNFIYPEVDIKKYDVGITIDNDARATVNIKVAFDELPSDEDSKDVPLTLVVPKQAGLFSVDFYGFRFWNFCLVITKFNMQMGNLTFPAEITDCDNCEQNFLNSNRMGQWTTKLWRSKAITGTNFRVLTVSWVL